MDEIYSGLNDQRLLEQMRLEIVFGVHQHLSENWQLADDQTDRSLTRRSLVVKAVDVQQTWWTDRRMAVGKTTEVIRLISRALTFRARRVPADL